MKISKITQIMFLFLAISLITKTSSAQSLKSVSYPVGTMKTIQFEVSGNCEKCKKNIEHIALELCGVKTAEWNISGIGLLNVSDVRFRTSLNTLFRVSI